MIPWKCNQECSVVVRALSFVISFGQGWVWRARFLQQVMQMSNLCKP